MIVSYRDRKTERFANGEHVKEFSGVARQAETRLDRLESATSLEDLAGLPGNRLEALKGNRQGQYSIRIDDQWRICFEWPQGSPGPVNVEIVDYHLGGTKSWRASIVGDRGASRWSALPRWHCQRVPQLTMMLAEAVNDMGEGPLAAFGMNDKDRYELKIARVEREYSGP